jgi:NhaP-type Na+/H+ and K+/H+ antiporter
MTASGLRPCLAIAGSVLAFALLIENAGLIPAVIGAVVIASRGSTTSRVGQALFLSLWLAAAMALLFVGFLDQPFTLLRGF